jgi:oxygen-independent coproporphyrinogen III oxidase
MSFSLYIHIPYCQSKCPYCDFNSHAVATWPEADYVKALCAEMGYRAGEAPWLGERLRTIFFGGGTPSLFTPRSIARIIEESERRFGIEADAEITLEANPGTVNRETLHGFHRAGVNRISFGAQSFSDATLKFLGRIHSAADTRLAANLAHEAGFDRMNLDLIFAVPGQTLADAERDIEAAVALGPDHISAYNLTFEEGTVFHTEMRRGRIKPLPNDEQAAQYAMARAELPRRGYPMYEISNYAPPGHEARHNLTYWHAESYLGLGAGAHSFGREAAGGRRWWNERMPAKYIGAGLKGNAEAGSEMIDMATAASEFVFLNLRLISGFRLSDFHRRFGQSFDDRFGTVASPLVDGGLLLRDDDRIRLSDRGLEVADAVFAEFL